MTPAIADRPRVDLKAHSDKMERCVEEVMSKGHDKSSAFAICTASLDGDIWANLPTDAQTAYALIELAFDKGVGGGVDRDKIPASDFAGPNRSYPIVTPGDVQDAASLVGKAASPDAVKRKIISIAKRKGATFVAKLPKKWKDELGLVDDPRIDVLETLDLALIGDGSTPQSWIQIAKVGTWVSNRYGKFSITPDMLGQMLSNYRAQSAGPRVPVDYDHLSMEPQRPGDGIAAGWFLDLELRDEGKELWGLVEWTPRAADAIKNKEYKGISPSFARNYTDRQGQKVGATLLAAAITNHPFLADMAEVQLSIGGEYAIALVSAPTARSVHVNGELEMADTTKGDMNQGKDDITKSAAGATDSKVYTFKDKAGKTVEVDEDQVDNAVRAKAVKMGKDPGQNYRRDSDPEFVSLRDGVTSLRATVESQREEILSLRNGRETDRKARLRDKAEARFSQLVHLGKAKPAEKDRAMKLAQRDIDASTPATEPEKIFDLFADWCDDHKLVVVKLNHTHGADVEDGTATGDPEERLLSIAEAKMKENTKLSEADALALAARENPELWKEANDYTTLTSHHSAADAE